MQSKLATRFGALYKLSEEDRLDICQQIAEACEKSFRRGFQQGYESEEIAVDLIDWRFATTLSESVSPHGTYNSPSILRHAHEVGLCGAKSGARGTKSGGWTGKSGARGAKSGACPAPCRAAA